MTILIIDAMPVIYQSFATVGHFCTTTQIPTGVRYGFLRSARSWSEKFSARKTVVCWDTKDPVIKAESLPKYKSDRVVTPEKQSMFDQIDGVKEMLSLTYYSQLESPGYEADDLCHTVAQYYSSQETPEDSVIVTVDRDLYSAVGERVSVYLNSKDAKRVIDIDDVVSHYGVVPALVPAYKAVLGDVSDNIEPLLKGTNGAPFLAFLEKNPTLSPKKAIESYFPQDSDIYVDAMLNLRATSLVTVPSDLWQVTKGRKDAAALTELFNQLEFASMMKFIPQLTSDPDWAAVAATKKRVKK